MTRPSAVRPSRPAHARGGTFDSSTPQHDDSGLVAAVQRAEPHATEELCRLVLPTILARLRRLSRRESPDFDDLVQTTVERVIRTVTAGQFRGECTVRAWAASIARNAAIDHHRTRRRERCLFTEEETTWEPDQFPAPDRNAEHALISRGELARLERILRRMKPMDAEAIMMRHGFGFSVSEVAAQLGRSRASVEARLARARALMRRRMGPKLLVEELRPYSS